MPRQTKYFATIENDQGAGEAVNFQTLNKNKLKAYIRRNYTGFKVRIFAVGIDGDGQSTFEPEEVETFKLRGP